MIRTAFIYLILGFTFGGLLLTHKGIPLHPSLWAWLPAHIEFLLLGWIVQLTMGVAFWILPRFWKKPRRPRETHATVAFLLLNLGIWLVVAGTTFRLGRGAFFTGRVIEFGAIVLFAFQAWKRIVSREGA
jgi:cbb3-type cytochrome oxidase subunit 1